MNRRSTLYKDKKPIEECRKQILIRLPRELAHAFKMRCAEVDITQQEMITMFIKRYLVRDDSHADKI